MAIPQKPKLLFEYSVQRGKFFRRLAWSVLGAVAALGGAGAVYTAQERRVADSNLLTAGLVVALLLFAYFLLRALVNLWLFLRRRTESLRFFNQGFVWTRGGNQHKYGWSSLRKYREGGYGVYLGKRPLVQLGGHRLTMRDGRVFKLIGAYGDLRRMAAAVRRPAAQVTGVYMGQTLRQERPVKLHRRLTVWPGGIEIGRTEIPWSDVDVKLRGQTLVVFRRNKAGKFKPYRRYSTRSMDNVGGFMEVATATIRNHQRERFGT
jgi:hypothetical protein